MYSSVPTKEFEFELGSAKKTGGLWSFDFLFLAGAAGLITFKIRDLRV